MRTDYPRYYTAILLNKDTTAGLVQSWMPFETSNTGKSLLRVRLTVKGIPLLLMTSQLESTLEYSTERKQQLECAWNVMLEEPRDHTVIFGGDLNIRDKEVNIDTHCH